MKRHARTIVVAALLAVVAALSLLRLRVDTSLESLFEPGRPAVVALERVSADFSSAQEMLLLASSPGYQPDPQRLLAFAQRFAAAVHAEPGAETVVRAVSYEAGASSQDFVTHLLAPNGVLYLSDADFAAAMRRLTPAAMDEQLARNAAMLAAPGPAAGALAAALLQDPLHLHEFLDSRLAAARPVQTYQNRSEFLSPDGRSLLIRIAGTQPPSDLAFCGKITALVHRAADRANTDALQLDFTGAYPIAALSESSVRRDSIESVIGSVLALGLLFVIVFRRGWGVALVTGLPIGLGVLWGFGAYAWINAKITPLTAVIGGMLAGIGIDYAVFFLVNYQRQRMAGQSAEQAAIETRRMVGGATVAAWVTSVMGFVAVGFASVRALRDFAIAGSLSLAGALLATLLLLPAVLAWVDRGMFAVPPRLSMRPMVRWLDVHAGASVATGMAVLAALLVVLVRVGPWVPMESDATVLHPRPNPPLEAERSIALRMGTSPDSVLVYFHADTPEQLVETAYAVQRRLACAAARTAGVSSSFGLATLLPDPDVARRRAAEMSVGRAQQVADDFLAAIGRSPFDAKAYRPYAQFLKTLLSPRAIPSVADLQNYPQLAGDILPRPEVERCEAMTVVFLRPGMDVVASGAAVDTLRHLLADAAGATLTGMAVLNLDTQATIHHDLPRLTLIALGASAVYLLVHFRSITDALLAVLPSVCSMTCLLVFARLAGAKLNLANLIAAPLLVGIDIDYGIFLVNLARRSKTRGELADGAAATGLAVVLCATATLLGFGSLAFTSVPAVRTLGIAVAVGVGSCAAASLLFLLPLLLWRARRVVVPAALLLLCAAGVGCVPKEKLTFPNGPLERVGAVQWYDVNHDGKREFALGYDPGGRVDRVLYSDNGDGIVSRSYRLADYANESVPHVFLLLDSLPFETVRERYDAGDFRWFDPPVKLIAPFPSLTEICYSQILHAPPLPGMIDQYWDPRDGQRKGLLLARVHGYRQPWERALNYECKFWQQGLSFLKPDEWYPAELEQARQAIDASPSRVSVVYIASAASMICKHGRPGAEAVLDGARQLCLQLLYERRGAIKITMMADHGHNYTPSRNVDLSALLSEAGFHPRDRLDSPLDCVVELNALVTYVGIDTHAPGAVAAVLCKNEAVDLAIYQQGDQAIVRSRLGTAAIECRDGLLRYVPVTADVLGYGPVVARLRSLHLCDADGFAPDSAWFAQTLDELWPNAPRRIWDALHGEVLNTPSVMLSLKDGYYAGYPSYEKFITMASTHGGLNQINSATFAMSMTGRLKQSVPHRAVIQTAEPGFEPAVR